jgi:hypothetical protein
MEKMNTAENDKEKSRVLRLADDLLAGRVDADVAQIVKGGKYTSAQASEALELAEEKLGLVINFCEDLAQQWQEWVECEQRKGRPKRELTFGEFVGETGIRDEVRAQFLRFANGEYYENTKGPYGLGVKKLDVTDTADDATP